MTFDRGDRVRDVRTRRHGTVVRSGEEVTEVKWDREDNQPEWSYVRNDKLEKETK